MFTKKLDNCIAGTKQVIRAVREGRIEKIIIAQDIDDYTRRRITTACEGVIIQDGPSMQELGKMCGLSVGTAVAGIFKD